MVFVAVSGPTFGRPPPSAALWRPPTLPHYENATVAQHFARRTAVKDAAFLLPHLRPGMRLLDCGCGPGDHLRRPGRDRRTGRACRHRHQRSPPRSRSGARTGAGTRPYPFVSRNRLIPTTSQCSLSIVSFERAAPLRMRERRAEMSPSSAFIGLEQAVAGGARSAEEFRGGALGRINSPDSPQEPTAAGAGSGHRGAGGRGCRARGVRHAPRACPAPRRQQPPATPAHRSAPALAGPAAAVHRPTQPPVRQRRYSAGARR
jgi:hypothetical protein